MTVLFGRWWVRALAQVAVSGLLVGLLLWRTDVERVAEHVQRLTLAFVLFASGYYAACQLLSSVRWRLFLTAKGVAVPTTTLFSYYMIGMFFNNFLPGAVGGDAAKAYLLYRRCGEGHLAVSSVFLERFAGLLGLSIVSVAALAISVAWIRSPLVFAAVGGTALFLIAVALGLWWAPLSARIGNALGRLAPGWLGPRLERFYGALAGYREHPGTLLGAVLLSVVIQGLYALYYALVARGLGLSIDVVYFLLFLPPVSVLMLVPIGLGGLGLREAALVVLFAAVGVPAADILAVSLTAHALGALLSLWGGLLLLGRGGRTALAGVPRRAPAEDVRA